MFKSSNKVKNRGHTGTCIIMYLNTNTKLSTSRYIAMIDDMVGTWNNNRQNTNVICMEITVIIRKYYIFHLNLITIMRWRFSSKYVLDVSLYIIQPVSHLSSQTLRCNYWDSPCKLLPINTDPLQESLVALQDGYTCTKCAQANSDPYKSKIVVTAGKLFLHRDDKALPWHPCTQTLWMSVEMLTVTSFVTSQIVLNVLITCELT
jgi:hypothetical protein